MSQVDPLRATRTNMEHYILGISSNGISVGNRHAHYRVVKTFFHWLEVEYGFRSPMRNVKSPKLPKLILPSLTKERVMTVINQSGSVRNKALIALAVESGLRVAEIANIKSDNIDWHSRVVKIIGKGGKEAYAPFGGLTERYLIEWLAQYESNGNIWGIEKLPRED